MSNNGLASGAWLHHVLNKNRTSQTQRARRWHKCYYYVVRALQTLFLQIYLLSHLLELLLLTATVLDTSASWSRSYAYPTSPASSATSGRLPGECCGMPVRIPDVTTGQHRQNAKGTHRKDTCCVVVPTISALTRLGSQHCSMHTGVGSTVAPSPLFCMQLERKRRGWPRQVVSHHLSAPAYSIERWQWLAGQADRVDVMG
eukprot:1639264-Rhodomonas_salina.3